MFFKIAEMPPGTRDRNFEDGDGPPSKPEAAEARHTEADLPKLGIGVPRHTTPDAITMRTDRQTDTHTDTQTDGTRSSHPLSSNLTPTHVCQRYSSGPLHPFLQ